MISTAPNNGGSNGVILRVNRAQPVETIVSTLEPKSEFAEAPKELVPIQSPEASRRKRSSAS